MAGFQIFLFMPRNKMFPFITWKVQAICLQKLQVVAITFSLFNFLRRIPHSETDFNDLNFLALYWKCTYVGSIFSRCIRKLCSCKEVSGYRSPTVDTKTKYLCTVICSKKSITDQINCILKLFEK